MWWWIAGLVVTAVVFGTWGWFAGRHYETAYIKPVSHGLRVPMEWNVDDVASACAKYLRDRERIAAPKPKLVP